jgi:O-antigen/teichoic acid export membrane protein
LNKTENLKVERLINLALRVANMVARFTFIFLLAKYLDPASVGYYGIFAATVGYAIYFVGLDFYTFVSREILRQPSVRRGSLLKNQVALSGILYIIFLPFSVAFLFYSNWPCSLVWWFLPILFLEHINQEIIRLLTVLSDQVASSLMLFVRQGSWVAFVIALMHVNLNARNLNTVMIFWVVAGAFTLAIGLLKIKALKFEGWAVPVDWLWIKKGIKISSVFLVATLALRALNTLDRYWVEALGGIEAVGAYVLLIGVASTQLTFLEAVVFSFGYPKLIECYNEKNHREANFLVRDMYIQTAIFSFVFGLTSWLLLPHFLAGLGNSLYLESKEIYPFLLAAMTFNALSMVAHYALYAQGEDGHIILSHIVALPIFGVVTWLYSEVSTLFAVPIGLVVAFMSIFFWKSSVYFFKSKYFQ